jgi:hypothetical protein
VNRVAELPALTAVGSGALLGGWLLAIIVTLAFHDELASFFRNRVFRPRDASHALGYKLKKRLFPQPLNMILRLVLRLLDKLGKCVEVCGLVLLKEKLYDLELRLFMFFFVRAHGDVLGDDYDDYCAKFPKTANPPNESKLSHAAPATLPAIAELKAPIGVGSGALLGGWFRAINKFGEYFSFRINNLRTLGDARPKWLPVRDTCDLLESIGDCHLVRLAHKHHIRLCASDFKKGDIERLKGQESYVRTSGVASIVYRLLFQIEYGRQPGDQLLVGVKNKIVSHNFDGVNPPNEKS